MSGEDGEYNPPSRDYMIQYRRNKLDRDNDGTVSEAEGSLPFVIVQDNDFNNTRRFIDPSAAGTSLPRQYVLDGSNMLVQFASDPNALCLRGLLFRANARCLSWSARFKLNPV